MAKRETLLVGGIAVAVIAALVVFFMYRSDDGGNDVVRDRDVEIDGNATSTAEARRTSEANDPKVAAPTSRRVVKPTRTNPGAIANVADAGSIIGTVRDGAGEPIKGAIVSLNDDVSDSGAHFLMGDILDVAETDASGGFEFKNVEADHRQVLRVDHEEFASAFVPQIRLRVGETRRVDVRLMTGLIVMGVVKDTEGNPVEGADVRAYDQATRSNDPEQDFERRTTTDVDGHFELRNLVVGMKRIAVLKSGFMSVSNPSLQLSEKKPAPLLEFVLRSGASITGFVKDAVAGPLAGVRIVAHPMNQVNAPTEPKIVDGFVLMTMPEYQPAITKEDGSFTIDGLAVGQYTLFAHKQGYPASGVQKTCTTSDGSVEIVMTKNAVVKGVAVDGETNEPLKKFSVVVSREPNLVFIPPRNRQDYEVEDGHFEFGSPDNKGDFYLFVIARGFAGGRSELYNVVDGADIDVGTIRVTKGATVKGRIIDDKGQGIAGAKVMVRPQMRAAADLGPFGEIVQRGMRGAEKEALTDAAGNWQLECVIEGDYKLTATHERYAESETEAAMHVGPSGTINAPDLSMMKGGTLRGTTIDKNRNPVPFTKFQVISKGGFGKASYAGASDANGKYEIKNIRPGIYLIQVNERNGEQTNPFEAVINANNRRELLIADGEELVLDID